MHALASINGGDDGDSGGGSDATLVDQGIGEAALSRAARRFELPGLLRVLRRHGYAPEDIWFESTRGAPASPGMIVGSLFVLRMRSAAAPHSMSRDVHGVGVDRRRETVRVGIGSLSAGGSRFTIGQARSLGDTRERV